ncbi:MAG TPA: sigma-70 family RNA polymerase sigma factor [Candidatus Methylomirabilis sp.]|nr:sigma-70 family RNA polymerase sigma factor [Candidatus Methylomirabilis sp.]
MNNLTDEQLVAAYRQGDDESLELLIQRYLNQVYSLVFRYLPDQDEAEDLTQIVFVKIWKNIGKFKLERRFKTWVLTIAKNCCLDFLKKKNRPIPFSELDREEEDFVFAESLADKKPSALENLYRRETARELAFAAEKLSPAYRETVRLRYEEDLKFREIAELLKEPLETIKTRHRRAIRSLRNFFFKEKG